MSQLSILVGFAAAGATLTLYQLGGGGALGDTLLSPSPNAVTPLLWTTANRKTYDTARETIDFYSGTVIEGRERFEEAGERLYQLVRDVASGSPTRTETLKYQDPAQVYLLDAPF